MTKEELQAVNVLELSKDQLNEHKTNMLLLNSEDLTEYLFYIIDEVIVNPEDEIHENVLSILKDEKFKTTMDVIEESVHNKETNE